jgi:hypothetical protein
MYRTLMLGIAVAGLALAGCGSDGGGDGASGDLGGPQAAAAAATIESASSSGLQLDEACVNDLAAQLSDEDAEAIVSGGDDAEISAEGQALGGELLGCADADALVDAIIAGINESGQEIDEDCARAELADEDVAEVVAAIQGGDMPPDLVAALVECIDVGG